MIKIDVVSGFLGSGKTTFIKKILFETNYSTKNRILVVVNDFGEENVDAQIIKNKDIRVLELTKGCLCCSLKNEFKTTLLKCLKFNPQRVLIEPSGIFLLDQLLDILDEEELKDKFILSNVITVINSIQSNMSLLKGNVLYNTQIMQANIVILNSFKVQKVFYEGIEDSKNNIVVTMQSVDTELINRIVGNVYKTQRSGIHLHPNYQQITLHFDNSFDSDKVIREIYTLIEMYDFLRVKGILKIHDGVKLIQYFKGYKVIATDILSSKNYITFIGENIKKFEGSITNKIKKAHI